MEEGVEIVGVSAVEPVHEQVSGTALGGREDLEGRFRGTVTADLAANNYNATVGQDES